MLTRLFAGFFAATLVAGAALAGPPNGSVILVGSDDGPSGRPFRQVFGVQNADRPWSLEVLAPDALRFEIAPGDRWGRDAAGPERSEIAGSVIYPPGQEIRVGYDITIEEGAANTALWLVVGQFHADDKRTSPPLAFEMRGEKLAVMIRYRRADGGIESRYVHQDEQELERGRSYSIRVETRFSMADGALKVWRDGEQIVDYAGPLGYDNGVYWKQGIYRSASAEVIAVTYRNLVIETGEP